MGLEAKKAPGIGALNGWVNGPNRWDFTWKTSCFFGFRLNPKNSFKGGLWTNLGGP